MRAGDRAWLGLGAAIVVYELSADDGELLSEAADRAIELHPWLIRIGAALLACHVVNLLPERADLLHHAHAILKAHRKAAA